MKDKTFYKLVEWSDTDHVFVGYLLGLCTGGVCHGTDEAKVYKELINIAKEWQEIAENEGIAIPQEITKRNYSGKFNVRIAPELHKRLTIEALKKNTSLNQYCAAKLAS